MAKILWAAQYCSCRFQAAPIALELKRRGHQVIVLSTPPAERWFTNAGFEFRAERRVPPYDWSSPELTPIPPEHEASVPHFRRWFIDGIPDQCADVLEALEQDRFALVLTDFMLYGPGFAAEKAGVPWASYAADLLDESETHPAFWQSWWDKARARVALPPEPRPMREVTWWTTSPHLDLILGVPELVHPKATLPSYVHRIGPVVWDPPFAGTLPAYLEGLGRDRPAVLISTSSTFHHDADLVVHAARGLADLGLDLVATVPTGHELPELAREVLVTGYVPHGNLMPKVTALVCSGGLGMVTRAVAAGVPLVTVPRNPRDERVARAIERAGAGIALDPHALSPEGIRGAVVRILGDPEFTAAAARLQAAAGRYHAVAAGADLIEAAIEAAP